MKFGKRIRAQCFSEWKEHYLDYNLLKTTLKLSERFFELQEENCEQVFFKALLLELVKVNEFYLVMESKSLEEAKKLERFEDKTSKEPSNGSQDLDNLYEQVEQLRKYVVFNYMAVVKIVKKRNKKLSKFKVRHLQSISFFINQPFYKTAKLAHLHHKLELLKLKFTQTDVSHQRLDFSCSICWELLNGPVLINCGHTFCLVCLESLLNASDSDVFACPNCRKGLLLIFLPPPPFSVLSWLVLFLMFISSFESWNAAQTFSWNGNLHKTLFWWRCSIWY